MIALIIGITFMAAAVLILADVEIREHRTPKAIEADPPMEAVDPDLNDHHTLGGVAA